MGVKRCPECRGHIQWLVTKYGGRKLPFDYQPVPVADDVEQAGWIPGEWLVSNERVTVLAPVTRYGPQRRERVRHVVMVHGCAVYKDRVAGVLVTKS